MHILWLHSDMAGCGSYRCYTPALSVDAIDPSVTHDFRLHKAVPNNLLDENGVSILAGVDLVVAQRAVGSVFVDLMGEAAARDIPVVYELDDDIFHIQKQNPGYDFWTRRDVRALMTEGLRRASHVITSTEPLAAVVREVRREASHGRLTRDEDVSVCPNHLHPYVWRDAIANVTPYVTPGRIIIGWQGSTTHDVDFKVCIPALKRILAEHPEVQLRFFGSVPMCLKGEVHPSRFTYVKGVSFAEYPAKLKFLNFDIALAPVTSSKFNMSKSNLKVLEAWALRQPVVASGVYPYAHTITHGLNGFIAENREEWYLALKSLVTSEELRRSVGEAGYATAWADWGPTNGQKWLDVFRRLRPAEVPYDLPVQQLGVGAHDDGAPALSHSE